MPNPFRRFAAVAAVLVVLAVILAACSGSDSSSSDKKSSDTTEASTNSTAGSGGLGSGGDSTAQNASSEPVGAEAAVAGYLKGQGLEYAGDCATAKLPQDKGKWCSTLKSTDTTAGTETYDIGPVGEKPEKSITVKRRGAAELTPGFQVGVGDGNVGTPQQLTREQLQADAFITGNLVLDQQAGIGNGLSDLPAGAPENNGGTGGGGGGGGAGTPTPTVPPGGGGTGGATGQYPPQGTIVVETPTVTVGGEAVFRGSGCLPNETLQVSFDGHPIGTITSDASGSFAGSIAIPKGTAPGTHLLHVQGAGCSFSTSIVVAGGLAFTGSSSHTGTYVLVGFAAVVIGVVLVVGTRRRRKGNRGRFVPPSIS